MQAAGGTALTTHESLAADDHDATPPRLADRGRRATPAVLALFGVALLVVVVDTITKQLAVASLPGREPVRLLGGAVYLLLTRNSGAAFSFASNYTFVFPIIALVVMGWICWMSRGLRSLPWGIALGLVLGGTMGNFLDRMFRAPGPFVGHVVDFISLFDAAGQGFPVFNAADSALCVGVGLAIVLELKGRRRDDIGPIGG